MTEERQAQHGTEFRCAECTQWVWRIEPFVEGEPPLCALCLYLPEWFLDKRLLITFCPECAEGE